MDVATAEMIWLAALAYFGSGVLVAIALVCGLVRRIDPLAADAPWRVRMVLVFGMTALWPILLAKMLGGGTPPSRWQRRLHLSVWTVLTVVIVASAALAIDARHRTGRALAQEAASEMR